MRQLVPTNAKFIAGAKAFRIWVETDGDHLQIGETLTAHIQAGRRVIVPETRFKPTPGIPIEDYNDGPGAAQSAKIESKAGGMRVFDDYPDGEDRDAPAGE